MSLEGKLLHWFDLGTQHYSDVCKLQSSLVERRAASQIPDTLLAFEPKSAVVFGTDTSNSRFSKELLGKVSMQYGAPSQENILAYLTSQGIEFYQSAHGGGATTFAPGQSTYFLIADHPSITGKPLDMANYKARIYKTLFESLQILGVNEIEVGSQQLFQTRNERKDVWVQRNGVSQKMGSKGLKFSGPVAHYGFTLSLHDSANQHSWMVDTCGYKPGEIELASVQSYTGIRHPMAKAHQAVRESLSRNFGYKDIRNLPLQESGGILN